MKVKTAIEKLKKLNPEATLKIGHPLGEEVLFILSEKENNNTVWIETESDTNMSEEIRSRFEYALEDWDSELDFYMDLLEIGITVQMVRKYAGNKHADHMEQFCKKHGLI